MNDPSAFDLLARTYDDAFTSNCIAWLNRQAVWRRADALFPRGSAILEMNCGTGEDAAHLAARGVRVHATDVSPEMLRVASEKVAKRNLSGAIQLSRLAWEELDSLPEAAYDGVLSDFGGLNCVLDLDSAAAALARRLRPAASALLCVMGPFAIWEWIWYGFHLQPSKAVRRLRRDAHWRGIPLRYPSPRRLARAFSRDFRVKRIGAIGIVLPPCFAESLVARWPRLIAALNRWERRLETVPPFYWLGDHYVVELERL
jgi:ubiquinone/menaquinone biosynthesis C-methylase UbiE